jgi:hypothetical protein
VARDHARIQCDIWGDKDWVGLSALAKLLYVQLLSQPKLSYAGLLDMAVKRWARAHPDHSIAEIRAALSELDAARMLVVDHDTEEVLVRTLVRNDGIYKQPQVLAAALRQAFEIESPILRAALAAELRRLPVTVCGAGVLVAADALEAGDTEVPEGARMARRRTAPAAGDGPATTAAGPPIERADDESGERLGEGSGNPAANPAGKPSTQAQGEGGRGNGVRFPLTLGEKSLGSAPRARPRRQAPARTSARSREDASRLVVDHVPVQPRRVTDRLVTETAVLLAEGIAPDRVIAGLRLWARKRVGAGLLAELVGEAMRERATSRPLVAVDAQAAWLAMARRFADEDQDDTELGRILRTEPDDRIAMAALLDVGSTRARVIA